MYHCFTKEPFWERFVLQFAKCYGNFHNMPVTSPTLPLSFRTSIADRQDALRLLDLAVMEYELERVLRVECWMEVQEKVVIA